MPAGLMLAVLTGAIVATATAQTSTSLPQATVISPDGLNLRSAPNTSGALLEIIPFGVTVTLTGSPTSDNWFPVIHDAHAGWVAGSYLAAGTLDAASARTAVSLAVPSLRSSAGSATPAAGTTAISGAIPVLAGSSAVAGSTLQLTASYYGIDDSTVPGTMMACGAPFDPYNAHGAATNDFSCGTKLLVTGPDGRQVDVVVMDHGGYTTRWMDLTYAAFSMIADHRQGAVPATVKVLP